MRTTTFASVLLFVLWSPTFAQAQSDGGAVDELAPTNAETVATGVFRDGDPAHPATGSTIILKPENGGHVVRLERLNVRPGPDLWVYLSRESDPLFPEDVTDEYVSLGRLKAHTGSHNYTVRDDIDPLAMGSVVVWCEDYKVIFGVATIERP